MSLPLSIAAYIKKKGQNGSAKCPETDEKKRMYYLGKFPP